MTPARIAAWGVAVLLAGCYEGLPSVVYLTSAAGTDGGTAGSTGSTAAPSPSSTRAASDPGGASTLAGDTAPILDEGGESSGAGGEGPPGPVDLDMDGCPDVPELMLTLVEQFTQTPVAYVQAPGDPRRFVAERPGRILVRERGQDPELPFLDLRSSVAPLETERGLLDMALHPEFGSNGRFYVTYTRAADDPWTPELDALGDLVLAEGFASLDDPYRADPRLEVLLTIPKDERYHNGGSIAFGPDGYLYLATGEDGRVYSGFERDTLQELDNRYGKILRLDVDDPGAAPPGNLEGGDPLVWDYGLRNPWRMTFDRQTGDLWIGDVGERSWEEINFEPAGQGGNNYGWAVSEGPDCDDEPCDGVTGPILAIPHDGVGSDDGTCYGDFENQPAECNRAVVGGYVYRGQRIRELDGRYFYGDNLQNYVRTFVVRNGAVECETDLTEDLTEDGTLIQGIVSFAETARGELHILDLFGHVYRIDRE